MARSSVVLPQPEGPRKQTNSPSAIVERDVAQRGEGAEALGQRSDCAGTGQRRRHRRYGGDGPQRPVDDRPMHGAPIDAEIAGAARSARLR